MPLISPARARLLAPAFALLVAACGSDNPSGVDDASLASADRTGVGTSGNGGTTPSATRASACNGTLGAITVEQVSVPAGATCTLDGTRVRGDVKVARDGSVIAIGARIDGNLQLEEGGTSLVAANTRIGGDLQVKQAASASIATTFVRGNLQLEENAGRLAADRANVRGNLQVFRNRGGVRLVDNRVAQALQCKENSPAPLGGGNVAGEKEEQCRAL